MSTRVQSTPGIPLSTPTGGKLHSFDDAGFSRLHDVRQRWQSRASSAASNANSRPSFSFFLAFAWFRMFFRAQLQTAHGGAMWR